LVNISSVIPNGVVVFFPSHKYLQQVCKVWKEEGVEKSLERHKKVNCDVNFK
jgi:Rad3-related DNA helicase